MIYSIGMVTNELLKYSSNIESKLVGRTPITVAYLSTVSGMCKIILYIAQVSDTLFTVIADPVGSSVGRYLPTGQQNMPFILEIEKIRQMQHKPLYGDDNPNKMENITYSILLHYIHTLLIDYNLVYMSQNLIRKRISTLGFNSLRLTRSLDRAFTGYRLTSGTMDDLLTIVVRNKNQFILSEATHKDMFSLAGRLSDLGMLISIDGNKITDVTMRRK